MINLTDEDIDSIDVPRMVREVLRDIGLRPDAELRPVVMQSEVMAETGLSKCQVSRALNGAKEVSRRTRRRVLDAAARLGYSGKSQASQMIDDGLDFLSLFRERRRYTCEEIAIYCGCSWQAINLIEHGALAKIRRLHPDFGVELNGSDARRVRRDQFCHGSC